MNLSHRSRTPRAGRRPVFGKANCTKELNKRHLLNTLLEDDGDIFELARGATVSCKIEAISSSGLEEQQFPVGPNVGQEGSFRAVMLPWNRAEVLCRMQHIYNKVYQHQTHAHTQQV